MDLGVKPVEEAFLGSGEFMVSVQTHRRASDFNEFQEKALRQEAGWRIV